MNRTDCSKKRRKKKTLALQGLLRQYIFTIKESDPA